MAELKNSEVFSDLRITYTLGATVKLEDFSNVKPEYTVSATVADGVNPHEAKDRLKALVHGWLESEIDEIKADLR